MNTNLLLMFMQNSDHVTTLDSLRAYAIPVLAVLFLVLVVYFAIKTIIGFYKVVTPDKALIVSGRGDVDVVTGGGRLVWPVVNKSYELDLRAFQVRLELANAPNKERIPISMVAMATCKIDKEKDMLRKAAESFGQKSPDEIKEIVYNAMEGHLRIVIGQINMDTILSERDKFNSTIQNEAATELAHLGVKLTMLNILEVSDPNGVIDALGTPEIAKIKAEAAIQTANEKRRQTINTTTADREGATVAADNEAQTKQAQRDKDMKVLEYDATVSKQRATTEQAGPLASATARNAVVQAEVGVEMTRAEAETKLQEKIGEKTEAELKATVLKRAEAERQKLVIEAEGTASARVKNADGEREALIAEGEGQSSKTKAIGLAGADVAERTGLANAKAKEADLLAGATGKEAELLALAKGTEAELLAQAAGRAAMIQAQAAMDDPQRELYLKVAMLDRLPGIIKEMGNAGEQIMGKIADVTTAHLAHIGDIRVYDMGGNGTAGSNALSRTIDMGPQILFNTVEKLRATGMLDQILAMGKQFGFDFTDVVAAADAMKAEGAVITETKLENGVHEPVAGTE